MLTTLLNIYCLIDYFHQQMHLDKIVTIFFIKIKVKWNLLFIRGVNRDFETEEISASTDRMQGTTTSSHIFKEAA